MKQDPRGPRDFYAPPKSLIAPPASRSRRAMRVLALLYVLSLAATILLAFAGVERVFVASSRSADAIDIGMQACLLSMLGLGWALSLAAFLVRREEGTRGLAVFVLVSGLATAGFFALVSLPIQGGGREP